MPANLFPINNGGGFFTKNKIQIQPIIIDLIAKLELIIIQQELINQNINEMNSSSLKQLYETNIKLKTFELLILCKTYITELQNLNIKIYEKKKYEKLDEDYSNTLLKLTMNKITTSLTKSFQPSRATRAQSRVVQEPSSATRAQSRATQAQSRAVHKPSRSSSFYSQYDKDVLEEFENLERQIELERQIKQEKIKNGGRIRRVKKENKKNNEKKITTNKIKRKYLVKK